LCKEKGELQSKNNEFETTFEDLNSRLKQSLNKNDELERTIFTLQKDIENHEKLERKHREQIDIFEEKIMGIPKIISNIIMQFIDLFQNLGDIMV
jgi:DNA repair exonuclease SbcCD ATPase subunit